MLIDFTKFIAALEAHTKALLVHAEAVASGAIGAVEGAVVTSRRGRKAAGEADGKALTPDQIASSVASAASAAAAAPAVVTVVEPNGTPLGTVAVQPTLQQVADAIIQLANSADGGRDKAVAILTKYGVKKVPELKPENFTAVLAEVAAAKNPPAAGAAGLF